MWTDVLPGGPPQGAPLQTLYPLQAGSPQNLVHQHTQEVREETFRKIVSHIFIVTPWNSAILTWDTKLVIYSDVVYNFSLLSLIWLLPEKANKVST